MASRIQGITVEIGGDTTKLSKALESVNKSIKGTQSGLKDVNKLLKLDPSNTELVVQKQKMLKDAIEATKEKLATLKTAAQQANEQLANGEITQQQYDALQREIVETEQNLRSLQDQAATTNATLAKIDEAGEKLQNIGSSVENVGKKFLPVTAAVTGLGTAAVKTAADFDSEMSKLSAISGATGDDFDQLRAKAREMGAKTKFSASEATSAMEYMAMAGWKTSDMLNGIEGIMNLAAASGEDLATTSDIVTDALTAFGLSAADSGHFADILAAASSNANTNVSMMGETFKYCAPIAGALGFSAEDTAEAIGLMANSGIKASQAGTSLRTIMNNLSGEVTFVGKNIGEVTIATSNADGSMRSLNDILADCRVAFSGLSESEKAANAEALVGKNAMSGFLALMNASQSDIDKLSGAIENCDGASESMAETMQDNLNGQLTILKSQLEELAISFGDILMPTIRKIVSAVQQFVDKLNSMDESTRETIIKIGLLAASIDRNPDENHFHLERHRCIYNADFDRIADNFLYDLDSHPDRDLHRVDCDPDRSDYGVERHCIVPISAADWHPDPDEHGMECDQDSHLDGPFCNPVHGFFHLDRHQQYDFVRYRYDPVHNFCWVECGKDCGYFFQQQRKGCGNQCFHCYA